jgi:hypothetical protein
MATPALVDDVNTEVIETHPEVLSIDLFQAARTIESLRKAGVVETTGTALVLTDPELSYERYESLGKALGLINRACSWWIGDWLIFGEGTFREKFAQAASATGLAEQTLVNRMYVCRNVPPSRRVQGVSFSVHAEVAPLSPREQTKWLRIASERGLSRAELRGRMKATRKDEGPLDDLDDETPNMTRILPAVRRLLRNAEEAGENVICRREDIVQLRSALGEEPA